MKKLILAATIFVVSFQTIAFGQTDSPQIKDALAKLGTLLTDHIAEKAFLHLDRPYPYYVAGDVIYFKAYVTMGERHEPSTISNMLHADLIDNNNVLLRSITIQLTNGTGWGDFPLSDTLKKGTYHIRAYTQWMRNDAHPAFFDQYISVSSVNSMDRMATNTSQALAPSLQFFPEGGSLITDVRSKVAFKALSTSGMGMNVKGVVIDNQNTEVAKIASLHLGMGVFDFIPEEGRTYKAKVTFGDGSLGTFNLPAAAAKGITLAVNTTDPAKVSIEVKANRAYYKENQNKDLNLVIYSAGGVRTVKTKLDNAVLGLDLPAGSFHSGVLQVTLMSQTGEPMSERLAFIQNQDLLNLAVSTNKQVFAKRENVQLSLNAKNKDGNAVSGSFSIGVVDESKILVDDDAESTILSYLLLTSDLKGYIEKPNYYFANVSKDTRASLDALMLTQGFRRFVWKDLMNSNVTSPAIAFTPEKTMDITGYLKTKNGAPIPNCKITLISKTGGTVLNQETDAQGKFTFPDLAFDNGTAFILKMTSSAGRNAVVSFEKSTATSPEIIPGSEIETKYNANADILASFQNTQANGVVTASSGTGNLILKGDKIVGVKSNSNYRSSNLGGPGHADQVISGDVFKDASSLSIGLSGLARGVQFSGGIPMLINGKTVSQNSQNQSSMLVVVDGSEVGQNFDVDTFNPSSIETVEILKGTNTVIYGEEGGGGVMVITTRMGGSSPDVASKEMSPGIFEIQPKGLYKAREFYMPAYDTQPAAGNTRDNRTTIFWKPDAITDANGNASFNYFNADGAGSYRVVVQGMDAKGNLGWQVLRYKVQ